jgi:predicted DNA-binding transcriptional regulator YafY
MNKLDIALKLLRLLNERKALDSRIVATELNVSLRTAQRYLLELSGLPCVIADEKEHIYALNPDYHLREALLHVQTSEQSLQAFRKDFHEPLKLKDAICTACDSSRRDPHGLPSFPARICSNRDNRQTVNQLVNLIRKRLKEERRGYP